MGISGNAGASEVEKSAGSGTNCRVKPRSGIAKTIISLTFSHGTGLADRY
jgi:hypothetical protein